jgi:hypothetical protein
MTKNNISLEEFAKQYKKIDCMVCALPERDEVDEAYKNGVLRRIIMKWLWEVKGYGTKSGLNDEGKPIGFSESMMDKHFSKQHHFNKEV